MVSRLPDLNRPRCSVPLSLVDNALGIGRGGVVEEAVKGHTGGQPSWMRNWTTVGSRALRVKIRAGLGHEPGRGSGVHKIADFHDMLLLAVGIRWHAGRILEIELDLFHGPGAMLWTMMATRRIQDTSTLAQDAPDGACRTRKGQVLRLQLLIAVQIVENGSGPGVRWRFSGGCSRISSILWMTRGWTWGEGL